MTMLSDTYLLANGVAIPKIGFGTWQIPESAAFDAVTAALAAGYRHIDTARVYGNEVAVGRAVASSGIPRSEIFVTTKLPAEVKTYEGALASFEESMDALGLEYVDLYLIHAPWPWLEMGSDHSAGNAEAWRAMEEIHLAGRSRAIGVSNFAVADLDALIAASTLVPQVDQIKYYVGHTQSPIVDFCQSAGILVEGFSPLATGSLLGNPDVATIASKYGRSVAQLAIRYSLQHGVLPLPKTTSPDRMAENADVDFVIADEDMAFLDGLTLVDRSPWD